MTRRSTDMPHRASRSRLRADWWRGPWAERLLFLAVVLIPFQQALTLEIGFPLKASEILAGLGIVATLVERRLRAFDAVGSRLVLALAGVTLLSSAWTALTTDGFIQSEAYPHGTLFDLLQYTAYALLALLLFLALRSVLPAERITAALGWALRLAAIYTVIQFAVWLAGSTALEFVNGNVQLGSQYGIRLPRNGPMREGNYLGFFAVACGFVALRARHWWNLAIAVALVLYSQSTSAIMGVAAATIAIILLRPARRKLLIGGIALLAGTLIAVLVPPVNRFIVGQMTKLGLIENTLGASYGYSLRARTANAQAGFSMALENPILGVGQGRYALHYWEHLDKSGLPASFGANNPRPIANNVYAQIAAETGLVALLLFAALLIYLLLRARRDSDGALGLVAVIMVGLIAFPAWTNLMAWTIIAAAAIFGEGGEKDPSRPTGLERAGTG